jgi:hypothetical protein
MNARDKAIIRDLNRFKTMTLDDIAEIHFSHLKRPKNSASNVLKRLYRDGKIKRSATSHPYIYFGPDVKMKENSAKIGHFLAIVQVYKDICRHGKADTFLVEPKYGRKGTVEPDIFCIFASEYGRTAFFIEVQNSVYSEKTMKEKLNRYVDLFESGIIAQEPWQGSKAVFPIVLILSDTRYAFDERYPFHVMQSTSFSHFMNSLKKQNTKSEQVKRPKKRIV